MGSNFVSRHFGDTKSRRTAKQIEAEKYVFGRIPFQRWMLIPSQCLVQLCLGAFYSWSIFNQPIADYMGGKASVDEISETFYVCIGLFGLSSCVSGPWLERYGPRRLTLAGVVLYSLGHFVSALGCYLHSVPVLYVGYGVVGGVGIGMAYICPVAVLQKWYPEMRGLAAGISVGSFGAGSVISSFSGAALVASLGPVNAFIALAIIYLALAAVGAMFARFPPPPPPPPPGTASRQGSQLARAASGNAHNIHHGHEIVKDHHAAHESSITADAMHKTGLTQQQQQEHQAMTAAATANGHGAGDDHHDHRSNDAHHHDAHHLLHGSHGGSNGALSGSAAHGGAHHPDAPLVQEHDFLKDIASRDFLFVYAMFFLSVIPGLVMISRMANVVAAPFAQAKAVSTWTVAVNGLFNVLGRAVFGGISDRFGRVPLLVFTTALQVVFMVLMMLALHAVTFPLFLVSMWGLTACYGSALGLIPGMLTDCFGAAHIGALYGVSLTGWGAGGVIGGVAFTAIIKAQRAAGVPDTHLYDICLYAMIPVAALAALVTVSFAVIKRREKRAQMSMAHAAHA